MDKTINERQKRYVLSQEKLGRSARRIYATEKEWALLNQELKRIRDTTEDGLSSN